jgi:threonine aldolase
MTIDLRSDTVTRPSAGMRAAMARAEVGDDVYGDDPTVNRLQAVVAERLGFEAGLYFPSGTQCNLAALMSHCQRGDEYLVGQQAHTYKYEGGGAAVLGSIQPQPLENEPDGSIALSRIEAAIKPADDHFARTRLLALENTLGGRVLPMAYVEAAVSLAQRKGLSTHLDGARLFNAAVKSKVPVSELAKPFDSVSVCLSKGLGAPVGSVLVGSKALLANAHRWRKVLGGGLRQAGILAAAGLYALEHHVERLAEDHDHATHLAMQLQTIEGLSLELPETNILWVSVAAAVQPRIARALEANNILVSGASTAVMRLVTHLDVSREDLEKVASVIRGAVEHRS